jgi:beta-lactamase class C
MGIPGQPWVDTPSDYDLLMADSPAMPPNEESGTSSQRAKATPQ